jgi:hypothetical protein
MPKNDFSYFARRTVSTVSRGLNKAAQALDHVEPVDRGPAERIENTIAEIINSDGDIGFSVNRIRVKYGIVGKLIVYPHVEDETLLIEGYYLHLFEGGQDPIELRREDNAQLMSSYLAEIAIGRNQSLLNEFLSIFEPKK